MILIFVSLLILLVLSTLIFIRQEKFGSVPKGERLEKIKLSKNFKNGSFQNLSETPDLSEDANYFSVIIEFLFGKSKRSEPKIILPNKKIDLKNLSPSENFMVWFGHSSYFMQIDGVKILVDPVFSGSASPIYFTTMAYKGTDVYHVSDFPEIDFLLISHDHWDHLDYQTILELNQKVKKVICGLGVGEHFEKWNYSLEKIIEKDWWDEIPINDSLKITLTPARHFSGRAFSRNKSLWTSFVIKSKNFNIYIGGDSGYDTHFKEIGEKYGPFNLAMLECGQYNKNWKYIHMMPNEVVQAAIDLKSEKFMPVHWAKFTLALHDWDEPINEVTKEATTKNIPHIHPIIGEKIDLDSIPNTKKWWINVENE